MPITTNTVGFTEAHLETECYAELHANLTNDSAFRVFLDHGVVKYWLFDKAGCLEAAEFFTKLADELERRKNDE